MLGIETDRHVDPLVADAGGGDDAEASSSSSDPVVGSDWRCLSNPIPPLPAKPLRTVFAVRNAVNVQNGVRYSGDVVPGAVVRGCGRLDVGCTSPFATTTGDADGAAIIDGVPPGFDGYYEIVPDGYMPSIYSLTRAISDEKVWTPMLKPESVGLFGKFAGIDIDANAGIAVLVAEDCSSGFASGVSFEVDVAGQSKLIYLVQSLPSPGATMTDITGSAVMFNAPPGVIAITAKLGDRNIRTVSALIRKGWTTFVHVRADQAKRWSENE